MRLTPSDRTPPFIVLGAILIGVALLFVALSFFRGASTSPVMVQLETQSLAQWKSVPNVLDLKPIDGRTFQIIPKAVGKCLVEFKTSTGVETFSVNVKSMAIVEVEASGKRGALFWALNPPGNKQTNGAE